MLRQRPSDPRSNALISLLRLPLLLAMTAQVRAPSQCRGAVRAAWALQSLNTTAAPPLAGQHPPPGALGRPLD
jgi:hypothetical protein